MSRDNSAQRMTTSPHEQSLLLDGVAGRPAVAHNGWPNGQKTVDAETLSGNCCDRINKAERVVPQGHSVFGSGEVSTYDSTAPAAHRGVCRDSGLPPLSWDTASCAGHALLDVLCDVVWVSDLERHRRMGAP